MAKRYLVANWKMNKTSAETIKFIKTFKPALAKLKLKKTAAIICPSFTSLPAAKAALSKAAGLGAQNMYFEDAGAYTGEVSPVQLKEFAEYVIIGHSERRHILGETDKEVGRKMAAAVNNELTPILAVGETKIERDENIANAVVSSQLEAALYNLTREEVAKLLIAYEPVWAIGTGIACNPDDASLMAKFIRSFVGQLYGEKAAAKTILLYGGSVTPNNIIDYLELPEYSGALIGGASLHPEQYIDMLKASEGLK